ncbi:hypothetical protein FLL57_05340 [Rhodopseudomonas palustris]|uniref:hypothetical protein n=1 Tax=Rhodopseudomonas palustris TaxID=1076 RepID=UPI00115EA876|nr:hypothetical protein [Rhodopseudomonas palustris]QDL96760.1 hypothetical protein FLL57_05340 [Rhodopseudomonas palustris]
MRNASRLEIATARSGNALAEIRRYDENWEPREQSWTAQPGSIEGAIGRAEARAAEAEAHLNRLRSGIGGNLGPPLDLNLANREPEFGRCDGASWINSYRTYNNAPDLFGRPVWPTDRWTVAVSRIDGDIYFGVNSHAPGYSNFDGNLATALRDRLISRYPEIMKDTNVGFKPNDALFHAEANLLIRANRYLDGLVGRSIEIQADRELCDSCGKVLPKLGVILGDPYVSFVELPSGVRHEMWGGRWVSGRYRK